MRGERKAAAVTEGEGRLMLMRRARGRDATGEEVVEGERGWREMR